MYHISRIVPKSPYNIRFGQRCKAVPCSEPVPTTGQLRSKKLSSFVLSWSLTVGNHDAKKQVYVRPMVRPNQITMLSGSVLPNTENKPANLCGVAHGWPMWVFFSQLFETSEAKTLFSCMKQLPHISRPVTQNISTFPKHVFLLDVINLTSFGLKTCRCMK